ncbi:MAG: ATP-binding cassette domain-containing protein [Lachnospiraceae bacterium]|nr:ATP-binding cassette domain-containing protein [Lachnospiraceae bacterium]
MNREKCGDAVIQVHQVRKSFGGETVLWDITRDFRRGCIHGIVGNNGSGKTVLMKCICGFLAPDQGEILVNYQRVGRDVDFPGDMGLIIETPGFLPRLTGRKNLELLASLRGIVGKREIGDVLRQVGLDPAMKKTLGKYSLGMRQRLGLAQAIMENPSILILDEPFNGLDRQGVAQMRELIGGLRDQGKTIILASHNQADIDALCDTVCEMDAGHMTMLRGEEDPGDWWRQGVEV